MANEKEKDDEVKIVRTDNSVQHYPAEQGLYDRVKEGLTLTGEEEKDLKRARVNKAYAKTGLN